MNDPYDIYRISSPIGVTSLFCLMERRRPGDSFIFIHPLSKEIMFFGHPQELDAWPKMFVRVIERHLPHITFADRAQFMRDVHDHLVSLGLIEDDPDSFIPTSHNPDRMISQVTTFAPSAFVCPN